MAKKNSGSTGKTPNSASKVPPNWETYEQASAHILNLLRGEFGFERVESKQPLPGKTGTTWRIDAKGVKENNGGIVVVECRRHTTQAADQEEIGGLAFRISDLGAVGGIYVSPLGFQEGAEIVARATNILSFRLDENSTPSSFAFELEGKLRVGGTLTLFASGAAPEFPPKTGGGFIICGAEPEASPGPEDDSKPHEAL